MRLIVLPGAFRPRSDTWQLARAACAEAPAAHPRILELCAGPAAAGVAAARRHRGHLTTVDVSRTAALNARLNAALNGVPASCRRGDLFEPVRGERFDLILANPPYVPGPPPPRRGAARAWDAGDDGRAVLDRICAEAPGALAPGGVVLVVHSELCNEAATLAAFRAGGLATGVADRRHGPLGPLVRGRRERLEAAGLLRPGQDTEDVVVLRGRAAPVSAPDNGRGVGGPLAGMHGLSTNGGPMADPVPAGSDVSAGTYACTNCGYELSVGSTKHLPPCPECNNGKWNTKSGGDAREDPYPSS